MSISCAEVGHVGRCCSLQFCKLPNTKLCSQHKCRECRGTLHSALCSVPGSGEIAWMTCLHCDDMNKKPAAKPDQNSQAIVPAEVPLLSSVQDQADKLKNTRWISSLPFKVMLCIKDHPLPPPNARLFTEQNLFQYMDDAYKNFILRFDPQEYPVFPGGRRSSSNEPSYHKLTSALIDVCQHHGQFDLNRNGYGTDVSLMMRCTRHRYSRASTHKIAGGSLRKQSLNCNKKNQRKGKKPREALKYKRASDSGLPVKEKGDLLCDCHFYLGIDSHSWFYKCGSGSDEHLGHPPLNPQTATTQF